MTVTRYTSWKVQTVACLNTHTKKATIMKREIEGQYKQYCQWDWRTQIGFVIACLIAACI